MLTNGGDEIGHDPCESVEQLVESHGRLIGQAVNVGVGLYATAAGGAFVLVGGLIGE